MQLILSPVANNLDLESVSSHTGLVLFNHGLAFLLGVVGFREEHAVVTGGLFSFADAAGLYKYLISIGYRDVSRNVRVIVPLASRQAPG